MRIPPHPKKYQAKNLIPRPSGWHLPQQDIISLLLSVAQFHIEKELSRVTGPFVFAIVLSDSPESSPGRCTRTAFPARSSSLSLAPHTPEHKAKERNSNQGRLQDSEAWRPARIMSLMYRVPVITNSVVPEDSLTESWWGFCVLCHGRGQL